MLYDMDDEKQELMEIEEEHRRRLRRKAIICGGIIICCFVIMAIGIMLSVNHKAQKEEINREQLGQSEESVEQKQRRHMQIKKHDLAEIQKNFVPQANPNAQQQIKDIYNSDEKVAYLTFDDGPSKNITPQILDILKQENVPATFFVLGSRVELAPEMVKREYEEGHYIANHGYTHQYSQIYRSKDTVFEEYIQCDNAVKNALGNQNYNTYLFRFPGGSSGGKYNDVKAEAKQLLTNYGIANTNWNCLTGDAAGNTTVDTLMAEFQKTMAGNGSLIILMHDASDKSYTVEALPYVISHLKEQGYSFKNFYEIF